MENNIKHKEFVSEYFINGFNATKAYMKVYDVDYNTAQVNGCKLLSNTKIKNEIALYKEEINKKFDNVNELIINTLIGIIIDGSEPNKIKAVNELNKMRGSHIETKNINLNSDLKDMFGFEKED